MNAANGVDSDDDNDDDDDDDDDDELEADSRDDDDVENGDSGGAVAVLSRCSMIAVDINRMHSS